MIICISATGETLDALVDPAFGRATHFLFVDSETNQVTPVTNAPGAHGAGVQSAQLVIDHEASVVITGRIGPNAFSVLSAAGIKVHVDASGTVRDSLAAFEAGTMEQTDAPTGRQHQGGIR
ncbi:NifB/NifX family molybdenum-iron cluster-binding protein [Candidatus Bipolaricaulota bacterium]|nr:NifB/NifX family molybdenum-iron cluster-binding protein [Candidatus Bipolaricaulota bacterium]